MRQQLGFETESLILREFTLEDAGELYKLTRQKQITDILPDWNMTVKQTKDFLEFVVSSYASFDPDDIRIMLAITDKRNEELIGWCGVFPNDKLDPADREIAYAISEHYRNQGLTTEAARGMLRYIFQQSSLQQIVAIVKPFNIASRRVIEKVGFQHRQLVQLSDGADYDYFTVERGPFLIRPISETEIEPFLDILAELEHVNLDRSNPNHEQWLRRKIGSLFSRGTMFFVYQDPLDEQLYGIISVLHEEAPEGISALGARAEVMQMGVSKDSRRRGIGSLLLQHVEKVSRGRGVYCLLMMTYAEDYDVIAFYGKNGFIPVANLPDVYGPNLEGNVFLRKVLR
ncbi:hypothetical protein Back11_58500 [Paenibacillus baekrokdamisoli]|uniref:Uncharacterized protein n=1 Tax=Paenibacillus baekrokdamisoli TaxID=1712516 RepID=A0A3G9J807_9BACL|nr:GNAT family N-acetyltransferase [Paenibacillus baekrokdamisoli]MBB3071464.1 RimJ/RimL family protein N-acetyltransferase/GNAT superfamily N-acetyltransferase [Paenibacillus baekrokdamisoli]BBH24505.1 hypothetical protein Back11_58500 [Paenibacillus baekrokdamisoli]